MAYEKRPGTVQPDLTPLTVDGEDVPYGKRKPRAMKYNREKVYQSCLRVAIGEQTPQEAAKEIGCTVGYWRQLAWRHKLSKRDILKKMAEHVAHEAEGVICRTMRDKKAPAKVRKEAAVDLLKMIEVYRESTVQQTDLKVSGGFGIQRIDLPRKKPVGAPVEGDGNAE